MKCTKLTFVLFQQIFQNVLKVEFLQIEYFQCGTGLVVDFQYHQLLADYQFLQYFPIRFLKVFYRECIKQINYFLKKIQYKKIFQFYLAYQIIIMTKQKDIIQKLLFHILKVCLDQLLIYNKLTWRAMVKYTILKQKAICKFMLANLYLGNPEQILNIVFFNYFIRVVSVPLNLLVSVNLKSYQK